MAHSYKGQRAGRPHVATWAETGLVIAPDLLAGDEDPGAGAGGLTARSVPPCTPPGSPPGRAYAADVGYFAADIAWAALDAGCDFCLGVTRNKAAWPGRCRYPGRRAGDRAVNRVWMWGPCWRSTCRPGYWGLGLGLSGCGAVAGHARNGSASLRLRRVSQVKTCRKVR